ncbi:MAG TPA: rhomboid family intramembrane serine protease [Anaerolineae bacterium]|nr:rhomboid family intramembrane serine protease [Anaerolineae bacterium]
MSPDTLLSVYFILSLFFLLPLKDRRSRRRGFPWVTASLVLINVVIHLIVTFFVLQPEVDPNVPNWLPLYPFMEVPALTINHQGLGALASLSSTYLHAGWSHLLGNMFILWLFGRKVEDSTGPAGFALLYTLCGFTASLMNVIANTLMASGDVPGLGASGAISGIMGAYLFLYSHEKILTLVTPVICVIPIPIPLWLPAWVFIVTQVLKDGLLGQLVLEVYKMGDYIPLGIGVFAHMGGFIGGMLFIYLFVSPYILSGHR